MVEKTLQYVERFRKYKNLCASPRPPRPSPPGPAPPELSSAGLSTLTGTP